MKIFSPYINCFVQPDTLVPNPANPQSLNRFNYVRNNPLIFIDPTGHTECKLEPEECKYIQNLKNNNSGGGSVSLKKQLEQYGVTVDPKLNNREISDILEAVIAVGTQFASERDLGESSVEAFTAVYDPITFEHRENYGGCETSLTYKISCGNFAYRQRQSSVNNIVHELGHVLNNLAGGGLYDLGWAFADPEVRNVILRPDEPNGGVVWQQNTFYDSNNTVKTGGEMFADKFVAWVFDAWNTNPDYVDSVNDARTTMNTNIAEWIK